MRVAGFDAAAKGGFITDSFAVRLADLCHPYLRLKVLGVQVTIIIKHSNLSY